MRLLRLPALTTLLALLAAEAAVAAAGVPYVIRIGKSMQQFRDEPGKGLTISAWCYKPESRTYECDAYRALKNLSLRTLTDEQREGGANPGALLCPQMGGVVQIGEDEKGAQQSFCRFGDGSLVDNGTLHSYARENDERADRARKRR